MVRHKPAHFDRQTVERILKSAAKGERDRERLIDAALSLAA
jgi:hypothetical protein